MRQYISAVKAIQFVVLCYSSTRMSTPGQKIRYSHVVCIYIKKAKMIPVELFLILEDDAGEVMHSICQEI